jgi:3-dehydroquinate synthase
MQPVQQAIDVRFRYPVYFTRGLFARDNTLLSRVLHRGRAEAPSPVLFVVDRGVYERQPGLLRAIEGYTRAHAAALHLACPPLVVEGGEAAKNSLENVSVLHDVIGDAGLCRRSYLVVVGGGGVIDMAGYAAATAHRGLRLVRIPTTVLAQADAGVSVKNAVNARGRKNFLGTFAPPFAVLNDSDFLATLSDRDWRSGMAEAIKAALVKDGAFFAYLETHATRLARREMRLMQHLIQRSAELHLAHLAHAGDAFEQGVSRPLDFGHWAAHKLEQLTAFRLRHGEAVALGIALDTTYSYLAGFLPEADWERVLSTLARAGFTLWVPELSEHLDDPGHPRSILRGLEEFRQHIGGPLAIMLLWRIGQGFEAHQVDPELVRASIAVLEHATRGKRVAGAAA